MVIKPSFDTWNCYNQRVLLRVDLNVPLEKDLIISDQKLKAIIPTLDALLEKNNEIILLSHIGRPEGVQSELSSKILIGWFEKRGYNISFAPTIETIVKSPLQPHHIILFENLRFFPGEKNESLSFAQSLAKLAPWYVNDAFGTLHRNDSSITLLANQYDENHRSIGFLVENELTILSSIKSESSHPITFVLGGGKISDKIPIIKHLCTFADTIVLCPALVFTFLKALGKPIGNSLIDENALSRSLEILSYAKKTNTTFIFPQDYLIAHSAKDGDLSFVMESDFPKHGVGIGIGPCTIKNLNSLLHKSRTIFYNGMMGFIDKPKTLEPIKELFTLLGKLDATTIVAGGDSGAIIDLYNIPGITYCLTGGGSSLAFLGGEELPGLKPFLKNRAKSNQT